MLVSPSFVFHKIQIVVSMTPLSFHERNQYGKKKKRRQENRSAFWRSLLSVSQTSGKQTKEWKQQRTQKWQTFPMVLQQHFSWRHEEGLFWTFYHWGLFWARDICAPYVQNTGQMEVMSFSGCIKLCTLLKKKFFKLSERRGRGAWRMLDCWSFSAKSNFGH